MLPKLELGEDIWRQIVPHLCAQHGPESLDENAYSQKDLCAMMRVSKSMYRVTGPTLYRHVQIRDLKLFLHGITSLESKDLAAPADSNAKMVRSDVDVVLPISTDCSAALMSKATLLNLVQRVDLIWERKYNLARTEYHAISLAVPAFRHVVQLMLGPAPVRTSWIPPEDRPLIGEKRPGGVENALPETSSTTCVTVRPQTSRFHETVTPSDLKCACSPTAVREEGDDTVEINIVHDAMSTDFVEQYILPGCFNRIHFANIEPFLPVPTMPWDRYYMFRQLPGPPYTCTSILESLFNAWKGIISLGSTVVELSIPCHLASAGQVDPLPLEAEINGAIKWDDVGDFVNGITIRRQDTAATCPACERLVCGNDLQVQAENQSEA